MKFLIILSAVFLPSSWCKDNPDVHSQGVTSFAYQDAAGNRYGGTYGLRDGEVISAKSDGYPVPFSNGFHEDFFPDFFTNYGNTLQEVFGNNLENQRLAYLAARRAYDITFNQPGYFPNFSRFPFAGFPNFFGQGGIPFDMSQFGPNSAFAGAQAGPGYTHQVAAINPLNPFMDNIDVSRYSDVAPGKNNFYSVSSSSYSSSLNQDGQLKNQRGAETVVNNNGQITKYKVQS